MLQNKRQRAEVLPVPLEILQQHRRAGDELSAIQSEGEFREVERKHDAGVALPTVDGSGSGGL